MAPREENALLILLLSLPVTAGCASSGDRGEREELVSREVREGDFESAVAHARRLAEANPRDPQLQALLRDAQVALVLDRARTEILQGELESGLALLERAAEIHPESSIVQTWLAKTRAQLAVLWLDRAASLTAPEQIEEAKAAYENVLRYDPENPTAIRGYAHLLLVENYRTGQSQSYFNDGLASFRRLDLEEASREFQISRNYRENDPAAARAKQVQAMIADERLGVAKILEDSAHWFAARNEYRLVLLVEPENAEARSGLDRMDREVRANRALGEADMQMRRGQEEEAHESLAEAGELTTAQRDDVLLLQNDMADRRIEDLYLEAQSLTDDYRYPEAVAVYEQLLAEAPDHQEAAIKRDTLNEFIAVAEEAYARGLAATTDEEAELALRAIDVIWPEYKDVQQRLAEIEARKPKPQPPAETPPSEEPKR